MFTDHFVEIDGCRTHYRRAGKGAPLVFLHGASGAPVVLPFMEKLAGRFEVVVPDHPGYGQSDERCATPPEFNRWCWSARPASPRRAPSRRTSSCCRRRS
jgi:pimeloyl-ACP methyl ester carboxylesterase